MSTSLIPDKQWQHVYLSNKLDVDLIRIPHHCTPISRHGLASTEVSSMPHDLLLTINHHQITPIGERYEDKEHCRNMHMHTHTRTQLRTSHRPVHYQSVSEEDGSCEKALNKQKPTTNSCGCLEGVCSGVVLFGEVPCTGLYAEQ